MSGSPSLFAWSFAHGPARRLLFFFLVFQARCSNRAAQREGATADRPAFIIKQRGRGDRNAHVELLVEKLILANENLATVDGAAARRPR